MTKEEHDKLVKKLNEIHGKLQNKPAEFRCGIYLNPGSILNAYREGDISFENACELLQMKS